MNDPVSVNLKPGDIVLYIEEQEKDSISMINKGHVDISEWNIARLINIEREPSCKFMLDSSKIKLRRNLIIPFREFNPDDYTDTLRHITIVRDDDCINPLWT